MCCHSSHFLQADTVLDESGLLGDCSYSVGLLPTEKYTKLHYITLQKKTSGLKTGFKMQHQTISILTIYTGQYIDVYSVYFTNIYLHVFKRKVYYTLQNVVHQRHLTGPGSEYNCLIFIYVFIYSNICAIHSFVFLNVGLVLILCIYCVCCCLRVLTLFQNH